MNTNGLFHAAHSMKIIIEGLAVIISSSTLYFTPTLAYESKVNFLIHNSLYVFSRSGDEFKISRFEPAP